MSITGEPGRGPMRVGIPIADLTAGLFAAQGIVVALLEREVSGEGQWLSTSLLEAQIFMLDFQAARWLVDREVPPQAGNNHPTSIPTGVFPTADGHMNIAVAGQAIWERFCSAMGHPEWNENPDWASPAARSVNRDGLNAAIGEVTATRPMAEWIDALNAAGVPAGPINTVDKVFEDPQVRHLAIARDVVSTERGPTQLVGQPVRLTRTPSEIKAPAPTLGEHNHEILGELGYDEAAIRHLEEARII
jgi:formyl-CoA transferase